MKASWRGVTVFTVGHSTRSLEDFIGLLFSHGVATVADIRKLPGSRRHPHFDQAPLSRALRQAGIGYAHLSLLAGLRRAGEPSPASAGWRNASFRAYAEHMQTSEFERGLEQLYALTGSGPLALMCAEAVRWRCHRTLVADALVARGATVLHIESERRARPHVLTPFARVRAGHVTYPAVRARASPRSLRAARGLRP